MTSRWKCIVAFGWPVVPEVKANMQVSSAAVATLSKLAGWRAIAASRPLSPASLKQRMRNGASRMASRSSSARFRSHSACVTRPLAMICLSSFARSKGIVATAIAPAFMTANQQATSMALFGARSSTRLPGTSPISSTSTWAMRLARASRSA